MYYYLVRHDIRLAADTFDLHALSTSPAFILSQDQTLNLKRRRAKENILHYYLFVDLTYFVAMSKTGPPRAKQTGKYTRPPFAVKGSLSQKLFGVK